MELYPAIDLRGGAVVRLCRGDFADETVYGDDPIAVAKMFASAGVPWIHVVDLDAARRSGSNRHVVTAVAGSVPVPVQVGGGVRDGSLLDEGVARLVIGSMATEEPDRARRFVATHPGRVAVGLDHRDGELRTHGWQRGSGRHLLDVVAELADPAIASFVVTDIARDGVLDGPDVDGYRRLVGTTMVPVIASGGVATLDHLAALRDVGVAGAIVGRALYEGLFTIDEAVRACAR